MKRYFLKLAALSLAILLPFAAAFAAVQAVPAQFTDSVMGTARHKVELLKETPTPRIILAGGSSSPYGTNCALIAKECGVSCINVGVTASLGVDFYISMIERNMRSGDIVIFGPENTMLSGAVNYQTVWCTIENFPQLWAVTPPSYWKKLVPSYLGYAKEKLGCYKLDSSDKLDYHVSFGPLGDVTEQRGNIMEFGFNYNDPIQLRPELLDDGVTASLNRFYRRAARRGVTVYFAFTPLDAPAVLSPPKYIEAFSDAVCEQLEMPVIISLGDAIMERQYFYNTNNHLNSEGAAVYSRMIADALRQKGHF